jgi:hypothetical protein
MNFLDGKKTYIIGGLIIVGSLVILLTGNTIADVPEFAWAILGAVGLGTVRVAINSASEDDNKGWKTYAAAVALAVGGGLKVAGVEYPNEALVILGALGLTGTRDAIKKIPGK